ncbi:MADS-box transcription factor 16-like [Triticum aestivum]|uniref:MADS-box transcription factor 16-like n=1 Tax=Triticum aestivum TaxID=4565 RepID=UPI001D0284AC|nr:MADS-box transcription factor 16-like [Triticum aestivum]
MGRLGKFEIKRIQDATGRQVCYSKRRSGIMKKARELAVLCDAQVAVVVLSSTGKHHHFCSDGADIKGILNRYQQATGTSLWTEQYEEMQRTLSRLKDINRNLRTEIRMGEDLDALEFGELRGLEQSVDAALEVVRQRKYQVITRQTETYKRKVKHSQKVYKSLQQELSMREDPVFGFMDNPAFGFMDNPMMGGWDGVAAVEMGGGGSEADMYAFHAVSSQLDLHGMAYRRSDCPLFG